jgi:integrase/recombinase XerD
MVVNHFSGSTIKSYLAHIKRLYRYYNLPLSELSDGQLIAYVCSLKEEHGLSYSSMKIALGAIKYFYRYVLNKGPLVGRIPNPKTEKHLKVILSGREVQRMFDLTQNLKHRLILKLIYSSGLRRSELISLRPEDLDWKNMQLTVRQGKGKKDRLTVLAHSLKSDYQVYINQYAPINYLFYGRDISSPSSASLYKWAFDKAVDRAGITKKVHLHTLRHCFASHLLSLNTDIVTVQKLLGHEDIRTTMIYLHLNHQTNSAPRSPMDTIYKKCVSSNVYL